MSRWCNLVRADLWDAQKFHFSAPFQGLLLLFFFSIIGFFSYLSIFIPAVPRFNSRVISQVPNLTYPKAGPSGVAERPVGVIHQSSHVPRWDPSYSSGVRLKTPVGMSMETMAYNGYFQQWSLPSFLYLEMHRSTNLRPGISCTTSGLASKIVHVIGDIEIAYICCTPGGSRRYTLYVSRIILYFPSLDRAFPTFNYKFSDPCLAWLSYTNLFLCIELVLRQVIIKSKKRQRYRDLKWNIMMLPKENERKEGGTRYRTRDRESQKLCVLQTWIFFRGQNIALSHGPEIHSILAVGSI